MATLYMIRLKLKDVMKLAKKDAQRTSHSFSLLITKVADSSRCWEGLELVK